MLTLGEKIRYLRTVLLRENQAAFAERLGFARVATISDYEKDKRIPDVNTLRKIACAGGVTLEWLLTGQDQGCRPRTPELRDHTAGDVRHAPGGFVEVKVYEINSAAAPAGFPGTSPGSSLLIPRQDHKDGTVAVRIKGDSMSPCIMDGGVVGIDMGERRLVSGELYAVWLDYEGATVKRVFVFPDRIVLKPDNPAFPDTTIPAGKLCEEHMIGRVVWLYQKF